MSERTKVLMSQLEYDKYIDKIKVCGTNRGPHDYIPTTVFKQKDYEEVTMFMCRVCFTRVSSSLLNKEFDEIKIPD